MARQKIKDRERRTINSKTDHIRRGKDDNKWQDRKVKYKTGKAGQ